MSGRELVHKSSSSPRIPIAPPTMTASLRGMVGASQAITTTSSLSSPTFGIFRPSFIGPRRRRLATAAPGHTGSRRRIPTSFQDQLNVGPSLTDFISDSSSSTTPLSRKDALELRTAMVGPEGKKRAITRLPEWLKMPIPAGDNFKKIKADLRGLNLHTGK